MNNNFNTRIATLFILISILLSSGSFAEARNTADYLTVSGIPDKYTMVTVTDTNGGKLVFQGMDFFEETIKEAGAVPEESSPGSNEQPSRIDWLSLVPGEHTITMLDSRNKERSDMNPSFDFHGRYISVSNVGNNDAVTVFCEDDTISGISITTSEIGKRFGLSFWEKEQQYNIFVVASNNKIDLKYTNNGVYIEGISSYTLVYNDKHCVFATCDYADTIVFEEISDTVIANYRPFDDVSEEAWYYDSVYTVFFRNLMNGTSETQFSPEDAVSRGMAVTILYRYSGNRFFDGSNPFDDVEGKAYYHDAVYWARNNKIANGYSSSLFGPNDSVTREQFTAILIRYIDRYYPNMQVESTGIDATSFDDYDQISDFAVAAMEKAVGYGLLAGNNNNKLDPKGTVTRAEAAMIITRLAELVEQ